MRITDMPDDILRRIMESNLRDADLARAGQCCRTLRRAAFMLRARIFWNCKDPMQRIHDALRPGRTRELHVMAKVSPQDLVSVAAMHPTLQYLQLRVCPDVDALLEAPPSLERIVLDGQVVNPSARLLSDRRVSFNWLNLRLSGDYELGALPPRKIDELIISASVTPQHVDALEQAARGGFRAAHVSIPFLQLTPELVPRMASALADLATGTVSLSDHVTSPGCTSMAIVRALFRSSQKGVTSLSVINGSALVELERLLPSSHTIANFSAVFTNPAELDREESDALARIVADRISKLFLFVNQQTDALSGLLNTCALINFTFIGHISTLNSFFSEGAGAGAPKCTHCFFYFFRRPSRDELATLLASIVHALPSLRCIDVSGCEERCLNTPEIVEFQNGLRQLLPALTHAHIYGLQLF